ncbi:MAG: hypothetical protein IKD34_07870 [Oscillospiraceae bacterium]|nr:hypothetical protein [Oscillospiraceae bacterium]
MNNFQGISLMDPAGMELFLEQVYLAGVNFGLYLSEHPDEESVYGKNPFTLCWLRDCAESAVCDISNCVSSNSLLHALSQAILLQAGISQEQIIQMVKEAAYEQEKRLIL